MSPERSDLSVGRALAQAREAGVSALDAQLLLARLLDQSRAWILAHEDHTLSPSGEQRWRVWLARARSGEPLAYLLGDKEFYGLRLKVTRDVLIPRPDTEVLVDWALERLREHVRQRQHARVIDLGTGSGAIALAILSACPQAEVTALEASAPALDLALDNARRLGLALRGLLNDRASSRPDDRWWPALAGQRYDAIVGNPPYVRDEDPHLSALAFEPGDALVAGPDGLDDLDQIVRGAPDHLAPGGFVLLEHGWDQAEDVQAMMRQAGLAQVQSRRDLAGHWRCTLGEMPTKT